MPPKKAHPLAGRIKRLMQSDDDVGKIAQATPVLIAKALELFLARLCSGASSIADSKGARTLSAAHVKSYVLSDTVMDFLVETVAKAPDLVEAEEKKPAKRQRKNSENGEAKPPGRGRGRGGGGGGVGGRARGRGRGRGRGKKSGSSDEDSAEEEDEAPQPTVEESDGDDSGAEAAAAAKPKRSRAQRSALRGAAEDAAGTSAKAEVEAAPSSKKGRKKPALALDLNEPPATDAAAGASAGTLKIEVAATAGPGSSEAQAAALAKTETGAQLAADLDQELAHEAELPGSHPASTALSGPGHTFEDRQQAADLVAQLLSPAAAELNRPRSNPSGTPQTLGTNPAGLIPTGASQTLARPLKNGGLPAAALPAVAPDVPQGLLVSSSGGGVEGSGQQAAAAATAASTAPPVVSLPQSALNPISSAPVGLLAAGLGAGGQGVAAEEDDYDAD